VLGIPDRSRGCLFDLDGVLTQTAKVHAAAWQEMFDDFLRQRAESSGQPFVPFDPVADYDKYVDGKPREDGTRSFLQARGINLPEGSDSDPPGTPTIAGLSSQKNQIVLRRIEAGGVQVYPGSVRYLRAVGEAGLLRAVVTSSANSASVLAAAGLSDQFDVVVDGVVARQEGLAGKPAPDSYLAAARKLGLSPGEGVVYEDALAGVAAGRAGRFGFVVGVDRVGQADGLREAGASIVVRDLAELLDQR
jgi:beta-phosphoglucomutase family hydrolase